MDLYLFQKDKKNQDFEWMVNILVAYWAHWNKIPKSVQKCKINVLSYPSQMLDFANYGCANFNIKNLTCVFAIIYGITVAWL